MPGLHTSLITGSYFYQLFIHHSSRVAALAGPYHKALAAARIAAGEHLQVSGGVLGIGPCRVSSGSAEGFGHMGWQPVKTNGDQHQIAVHRIFLTGRDHLAAPVPRPAFPAWSIAPQTCPASFL